MRVHAAPVFGGTHQSAIRMHAALSVLWMHSRRAETFCVDSGTDIAEPADVLASGQRRACPVCGSKKRRVEVSLGASLS
jgi:hypothetical protein